MSIAFHAVNRQTDSITNRAREKRRTYVHLPTNCLRLNSRRPSPFLNSIIFRHKICYLTVYCYCYDNSSLLLLLCLHCKNLFMAGHSAWTARFSLSIPWHAILFMQPRLLQLHNLWFQFSFFFLSFFQFCATFSATFRFMSCWRFFSFFFFGSA